MLNCFYAVKIFVNNYDNLLQNVTDTLLLNAKKNLLQTASGFLLQNATVLLKNAIGLQNASVITKCDIYYKIRRYTLINQCIIH